MKKPANKKPGRKAITLHPDLQKMSEQLQDYLSVVNYQPPKSQIEAHPLIQNHTHLPISFVEMHLDRIFIAGWDWIKDSGGLIVTQHTVIFSGTLSVVHPVTMRENKRNGVGSMPIIWKDDVTGGDIANAEGIAASIARSMAIKNACKSIGKLFGRELNRATGASVNYSPLYKDPVANA